MPDGDFLSAAERAKIKRRNASIERGLALLKAALLQMPNIRSGTSEKQIREAQQPIAAAKHLIQEFEARKPKSTKLRNKASLIQYAVALELGTSWPAGHKDKAVRGLDLSAATEARATLLRKQAPELRAFVAHDDDIGDLEHKLLRREISQAHFNSACQGIARRGVGWMKTCKPKPNPPPQRPIERIPGEVLHKALGCEGPELASLPSR